MFWLLLECNPFIECQGKSASQIKGANQKKDAMNKYRIYRVDPKNIAIQKREGKTGWRTISYHGNSLNSLISGLFELIIAQHTPNEENLLYALGGLQLELVSSIEKIEKMIKEWCDE